MKCTKSARLEAYAQTRLKMESACKATNLNLMPQHADVPYSFMDNYAIFINLKVAQIYCFKMFTCTSNT